MVEYMVEVLAFGLAERMFEKSVVMMVVYWVEQMVYLMDASTVDRMAAY